jgi:2-polyprenyl-3-methyl-5-hydroxy-6-metoxy-1,4-benzoquinol methylase
MLQLNLVTEKVNSSFDEKIRESWERNAEPWTAVVRKQQIPSRNAGTDQAIVGAIRELPKGTLLDVGCGEGWLCRAAVEDGWNVTGIDGSAALIERAREFEGEYFVADYADLQLDRTFDCIVCNYSILAERIDGLFRHLRSLLAPAGTLLIQTPHPWMACGDAPYADGWREETFQGWQQTFASAMPWYFRTLESWVRELNDAGLLMKEAREPLNPATGRPLSLLLVCAAR